MRLFKLACLSVLIPSAWGACSISVTAPAASATISGWPYTFTSSNSGCPPQIQVQYFLDQRQIATTRTSPYSYQWSSTAWRWNGTHEVYAVALDFYGNTLATSPVNTFVIDNSSGTEILTVTPSTSVTSTWSGTVTLSVSGGVNGYNLWIDGIQQSSATSIDTTKWFNGPHYLYFIDTGPGNSLGKWSINMHAMWAHQVTFGNGSSGNVELRLNASYVPMLPSSTFQLTCTLVKTDQSTTACTSPSWAAASPGALDTRSVAVSVNSSTGLVTAGSTPGDANVTVTANGLTRTAWVSVNSSLTTFPQFGKDGTILQSYDPSNSIFPRSWWNFADPAHLTAYTGGVADYLNGGANTFEGHPITLPLLSSSQTQAQWKTAEDTVLSSYLSLMAANPLYLLARVDEWINHGPGIVPSPGTYTTTRPPWNSWNVGGSGPPAQYITQQLKSSGKFLGYIFGDEVQVDWMGRNPNPVVWTPATTGGSITCTSGGTCTLNWGGSAPANWGMRTDPYLIITGSAHNTAINTAQGSTWHVTAQNSDCQPNGTLTFSGPSVNDTWNSANDPNLTVTTMAVGWFNVSGIGYDYNRNDAISTLMSQVHAAGGMAMWPEDGGALAYERELSPCQLSELQNYENNPPVQDFASLLYSFSHGPRWDGGPFVGDPVSAVYTTFRTIFAGKNRATPIVSQIQGTPVMFRIGGPLVPIASYSNGLLTFSQPHGVSNYRHGISRMTITGSSTAALNTKFVVTSIPSATTMRIALPAAGVSFSGARDVATFEDGTVVHFDGPATGMQCSTTDKCSVTFNNFNGASSLCANFKWGQLFTVASSAAAGTYWYRNSDSAYQPCTGQQPSISEAFRVDTTNSCSSNCGSAYVINDNDYIPGRNFLVISGSYPDSSLTSLMAAVIYGAGAVRGYSYGTNEDDWAVHNTGINLSFQGEPGAGGGDGVQPGAHPYYNFGGGMDNWTALSLGYNWIGAFERYILQPQQVAPDYGSAIAATVRTGSYGTLLMLLNTTETPQTRTVNLAPYITGSNTTTRYRLSQYGTAVATTTNTSESVTLTAGETIAYILPVSASDRPIQPTFAPTLSTTVIPNAAHIALEWAYDPHLFPEFYKSNHEIPAQAGAISCDSSCTLPADSRIKQIYYRYRYLDASGRVLATSDIMTIAKS